MVVRRREADIGSRGRSLGRRIRTFLPAAVVALSLVFVEQPTPAYAQTINGTLMEVETDQPISLGLIIMMTESGDSVTSAVTDGQGRFAISSEEPGAFVLIASAFGFKETAAGVFELGENGEMDIEFRVAAAPMPVEGLLVSLQRPVLQHKLVRNGFVRRVTRGLGRFITPIAIEESSATTTADLFRGIPGVAVLTPGGGLNSHRGEAVRMYSQGDYCTPTIYLDGIRMAPETTNDLAIDEFAPLNWVEAVEIYRRPSEIPVEYGMTGSGAASGSGPCGVLVIWTKNR